MRMTFCAERNNIEPMFRCVAFPVMVMFCLVATGTFQAIGSRQLTTPDGIFYSPTSFNPFWVILGIFVAIHLPFFALIIAFSCKQGFYASRITGCCILIFFGCSMSFLCSFAHIAFPIKLPNSFAFFCLHTIFYGLLGTVLAIRLKSVFGSSILTKLRERFNFFAFGTSFRYDLLSHFRLLVRRFWLEPVAVHTTAVGSLYCTQIGGVVKC